MSFLQLFRPAEPTFLDRLWQLTPFQPAPTTLVDRVWRFIPNPFEVVRHPLEAFISLPALSFLLIPTFTSYSTSLNILFFYLTWSTLILSHPPLKVEFIGTLAIRIVFYVLPAIGFFLFDSAVPNLALNIKEHGDAALPLGDEQGGTRGRWWKIVLVSMGNILLGIVAQVGIEYFFTEVLLIRSALKVTTSLPMPWGIAKDLFRGLMAREILTYLLHRYILHNRTSPLHSLHRTWYHSLVAPYSLTAHYDHPAAYLVSTFLPTYLPALVFRFHLLTYCFYLALVSIEELFASSGYNALPSGLLLGRIARRKERHLMQGGRVCFGVWGLCDAIAGTAGGGDGEEGDDPVEDVRREMGRIERGQKVKGKARGIARRTKKNV